MVLDLGPVALTLGSAAWHCGVQCCEVAVRKSFMLGSLRSGIGAGGQPALPEPEAMP